MSSRMDKYYENKEQSHSRIKRNEQLYQSINDSELESINLSSNAHVIGENNSNIDISKIKELLEKNYYEKPKKVNTFPTIADIKDEINEEEEETKEYDINSILKKAKINQNVDYERERLKKIHDTQYDILKKLDLEKENQESKVTSNKENLMNLINTITEKEMTRELNPLDILSDLKGSDNTVVLDGVKEKIEENDKKESVKKEETENKKEIDKSFYTSSLSFTQSDFDDFNDLKGDVESNKILVRVLLIIIILALVIGLVFLANIIFHLNWF